LETVHLTFDVKRVSLQCMQVPQFAGNDWLHFVLERADRLGIINEMGGQIRIDFAVLQVHKADDGLIAVDHGTVGVLKYDGDIDACCDGQIQISNALFERLVQSLVNGQKRANVTLQVRGLKRTPDGYVWQKRDTLALPVVCAVIATDLFESRDLG
jgi:hypothetical protein